MGEPTEGAIPRFPQALVMTVGGHVDMFFVQSVSEVTLDGIPNEGIKLDDDCILMPVTAEVREAVERMAPYIGVFDAETIVQAPVVNYLPKRAPQPLTEEEARRFLIRTITLTQQFLLSLWLVKDNSGNAGEAHLTLVDHEHESVEPYSQSLPFLNFAADCGRTVTAFTHEEVQKAVAYYRQLESILPQLEWKSTDARASGLVIKSRFYRALYSAQMARASAEIGVKIAFYCIAFEALFSTAKEAISHQIAERAAVLIEKDGAARLVFYRELKKVYNIRSTVVHGDALSEARLTEFREISKKTDDQLRKTLQRIMADAALLDLFIEKSSDQIEGYFLGLLFPATPPATADGTSPAN